jgi:DNA-binding response OmpR family regulator
MHTLMLVDDDPAVCEIFSTFLKKSEYQVHVVSGGKVCLDLLKTTVPDLILLDIMMEPMDGWETLNAIKKNPATRTIPVIMLTGKQPTYNEILHYGGWVEDYLMKPMDFKTLEQSLVAFFERDSHMHRDVGELQKEGFDPVLIREYYQLVRISAIIERIGQHFGKTWRLNDADYRIRKERLHQLQAMFMRPVSDPDTDQQEERLNFSNDSMH